MIDRLSVRSCSKNEWRWPVAMERCLHDSVFSRRFKRRQMSDWSAKRKQAILSNGERHCVMWGLRREGRHLRTCTIQLSAVRSDWIPKECIVDARTGSIRAGYCYYPLGDGALSSRDLMLLRLHALRQVKTPSPFDRASHPAIWHASVFQIRRRELT